jgi:hypothetical protein
MSDQEKVHLAAVGLDLGAKRARPCRQRKPSIRAMITQAEKAGKDVKSVTRDGVTLTFCEPAKDSSNPWDSVLSHDTKN